MPIRNYGVLKARPIERLEATSRSPHYQIHVVDQAGTDYRIAINVLSQVAPYDLLYHVIDNFVYPITAKLPNLTEGFTHLASEPGGLALDFIRTNIVDADKMQPVRFVAPSSGGMLNEFSDIGSETQLNDMLEEHVQLAMADPNARIYAFGDHWGPETNKPDQYFHFTPGNGIHDIHMNQGNDPKHRNEDGVWQDGALLISLPAQNRWMAVFLKFQSQASKTDDAGHAIDGSHGDGGHGEHGHNPHGGHHHHHHKEAE